MAVPTSTPATASTSEDSMAVDGQSVKLSITGDEEEALAHKKERENDERQLRRVSRKIHSFMQAKRDAQATPTTPNAALEEALQNLQLEVESFMLGLEKMELTLFAERRQAEEYGVMRERIAQEDSDTRAEIEQLKVDLREAEELREQKKEYDVIARRINALPARSDLDASIAELESEIATIHAEQESTHEILATKRSMMEDIRSRINDMILHGKEETAELGDGEGEGDGSRGSSPTATQTTDVPIIRVVDSESRSGSPHPSSSGSGDGGSSQSHSHSHLNPSAPSFHPTSSSSPVSAASTSGGDKNANRSLSLGPTSSSSTAHHPSLLRHQSASASSLSTNPPVSSPLARRSSPSGNDEGPEDGEDPDDEGPEDGEDVDDIEMGEVSQSQSYPRAHPHAHLQSTPTHAHSNVAPPSSGRTSLSPRAAKRASGNNGKERGRKQEEMEEGEASDTDAGARAGDDDSSDLSSLPDD